jgi:hypothetical protein
MALFAYRCPACDSGRDVEHDRHQRPPLDCLCGERMIRDYTTVQISPAATPTRRNQNPTRVVSNPAWERGIVKVKRGDGEVPLLNPNGSPVRVKQYAENRHAIQDHQRFLANSTTPI